MKVGVGYRRRQAGGVNSTLDGVGGEAGTARSLWARGEGIHGASPALQTMLFLGVCVNACL